jgi:hypothetical protein
MSPTTGTSATRSLGKAADGVVYPVTITLCQDSDDVGDYGKIHREFTMGNGKNDVESKTDGPTFMIKRGTTLKVRSRVVELPLPGETRIMHMNSRADPSTNRTSRTL